MTVSDLWRYGDWRHVAMGCTALVELKKILCSVPKCLFVCLSVNYDVVACAHDSRLYTSVRHNYGNAGTMVP